MCVVLKRDVAIGNDMIRRGRNESQEMSANPEKRFDRALKAESQFQPCLIAACRLSLVANSSAGFADNS